MLDLRLHFYVQRGCQVCVSLAGQRR
jgi:hypothetical protein